MRRNIKYVFVFILSILTIAVSAHATSVTTTKYNGKTYTVDVIPSCTTATIYFRVKPNTCSAGDIYIGKFALSTIKVKKGQTIKQAAATICTVKNVYDDGKTAVGCAASLGSVACVVGGVATAPAGGTGIVAVVCTGTITYTLNSGLKDCVEGVGDKIASYLAGERNWKAFVTGYGIGTGSMTTAIDAGIDLACTYVK
ncbi:MAG: hypothetical protein ABSE89_01815 [Sedimentisphaerales bacterium]